MMTQVLVVTAHACWGLRPSATLAVVAGTQYYDSSGGGGGDYPVSDLVQMMGRASRPGLDEVGKVGGWDGRPVLCGHGAVTGR
jgi:pre-mRNA-splicing helicase BRR2